MTSDFTVPHLPDAVCPLPNCLLSFLDEFNHGHSFLSSTSVVAMLDSQLLDFHSSRRLLSILSAFLIHIYSYIQS